MYELFEEEIVSQELGKYTAYGITYKKDNDRVTISDLSLDKDKANELVCLCNQLNLEPVHLYDAAEDFVFNEGLVRV